MAELVDAHALGACGETRGGSSPLPPIKYKKCGGNSVGRMPPCQGGCHGFESHPPL